MRTNTTAPAHSAQPARQAEEVDRHIGRRIRHRRHMLGLSQQELGGRMGLTYKQIFKYETGLNRIPASRLLDFATVLEVEVGYFYEGYDEASRPPSPPPPDRLLLELMRSFLAIPDRHLQVTLCQVVRALADQDAASTADDGAA